MASFEERARLAFDPCVLEGGASSGRGPCAGTSWNVTVRPNRNQKLMQNVEAELATRTTTTTKRKEEKEKEKQKGKGKRRKTVTFVDASEEAAPRKGGGGGGEGGAGFEGLAFDSETERRHFFCNATDAFCEAFEKEEEEDEFDRMACGSREDDDDDIESCVASEGDGNSVAAMKESTKKRAFRMPPARRKPWRGRGERGRGRGRGRGKVPDYMKHPEHYTCYALDEPIDVVGSVDSYNKVSKHQRQKRKRQVSLKVKDGDWSGGQHHRAVLLAGKDKGKGMEAETGTETETDPRPADFGTGIAFRPRKSAVQPLSRQGDTLEKQSSRKEDTKRRKVELKVVVDDDDGKSDVPELNTSMAASIGNVVKSSGRQLRRKRAIDD